MLSDSQNIIEVKNLVKKFDDFVANDHLTFAVKKGEIFGFLGSNGAGKTTTIKILCGILPPTKGIIKVCSYDVYTQSEKIKKVIGYMSQRFTLYDDLTISENIEFFATIYGIGKKEIYEKSHFMLNKFKLYEKRNLLVSSLPLGWKQKLAFLVANFHNPQIIFLDEPTSGVDPIVRRQFWDMIYETADKGTTIFITTHYIDEAEYCDRISIMSEGKIVALDTPLQLRKQYNANSIKEAFIKIVRNIE